MRKKSPFFQWIPLINLSSKDMIDLMSRAKVYIDFGNHPGKDRIPREAAIHGCCIITGKRGSARFQKDVSIPEEFKFDDSCKNIPRILRKIEEVFLDYENVNKKFGSYREKIRMEEKVFDEDLDVVCQYLKCFTKNMQGREVNEVI